MQIIIGPAYQIKSKAAFSLVEVMVSVALFIVLFTAIMRVVFPSSSGGHNQLRSYSMAMVLADWYLNYIESEIDRKGTLGSIAVGKQTDITNISSSLPSSEFELLRDYKVYTTCTCPKQPDGSQGDLYQIKITVNWSKKNGDGRPYNLDIVRYKVKPYAP